MSTSEQSPFDFLSPAESLDTRIRMTITEALAELPEPGPYQPTFIGGPPGWVEQFLGLDDWSQPTYDYVLLRDGTIMSRTDVIERASSFARMQASMLHSPIRPGDYSLPETPESR